MAAVASRETPQQVLRERAGLSIGFGEMRLERPSGFNQHPMGMQRFEDRRVPEAKEIQVPCI